MPSLTHVNGFTCACKLAVFVISLVEVVGPSSENCLQYLKEYQQRRLRLYHESVYGKKGLLHCELATNENLNAFQQHENLFRCGIFFLGK